MLVLTGADVGNRTPDLRFTKPLLYQLSYVGVWWHGITLATIFQKCHPKQIQSKICFYYKNCQL
jgi:hypothetical protein